MVKELDLAIPKKNLYDGYTFNQDVDQLAGTFGNLSMQEILVIIHSKNARNEWERHEWTLKLSHTIQKHQDITTPEKAGILKQPINTHLRAVGILFSTVGAFYGDSLTGKLLQAGSSATNSVKERFDEHKNSRLTILDREYDRESNVINALHSTAHKVDGKKPLEQLTQSLDQLHRSTLSALGN